MAKKYAKKLSKPHDKNSESKIGKQCSLFIIINSYGIIEINNNVSGKSKFKNLKVNVDCSESISEFKSPTKKQEQDSPDVIHDDTKVDELLNELRLKQNQEGSANNSKNADSSLQKFLKAHIREIKRKNKELKRRSRCVSQA
jgi:hypothetical protein